MVAQQRGKLCLPSKLHIAFLKEIHMKKIALAAMTALCVAPNSQAADSPGIRIVYVGGTVSEAFYQEPGLSTVNPLAGGLLAGWQANPHVAVELRMGANLASDTATLPRSNLLNSKLELEIERYGSLYLKGSLPVSNRFSFVGLAGFTTAKLRARAGNGSFTTWATTSDSSFSGAVGGEFNIGKQSSLSAEWGRLVDGDGYHVDALTVAYHYHFK